MYFARYVYRNYYRLAGLKYGVRRRLTLTGWMMLAATAAALGLGADTTLSLAYQAFAFLLCLILLSLCCLPLGRLRLTVERRLPKFGSVGEPLRYRLVVHNISRQVQNGLHVMDEMADPRPTFREFASITAPGEEKRDWLERANGFYRWQWLLTRNLRARIEECLLPVLPPNAEQIVETELAPLRRGVLRLEAITIICPEPFGLFRSLRRISAPQSLLILPRRYPLPPFELPGTLKYQQGGVSMASSVGESEEFVSLREYRPGDALRRMHWKSFAKIGKPIVKEFQDEFFVRHALILDTFDTGAGEQVFEEAVSVAASLACTIQNQDSLLDLMFVGTQAFCFTAGRGVAHIEQILEILASVQICREAKFTALEHLVFKHFLDISGAVCVLLAWDEPRQRLVRLLKSRGVPLIVFVITENGETLAPGPMADAADRFHALPVGKVAETLAALPR